MNTSAVLSRQGHRLLQVGVALFLFTSLEGFAIPYLSAPRLGLSVHTLSALQGVLLLALGLVWPRLNLGATTSRITFWLLIYSTFAILAPYVMGAT
jgi:(hydroxyamino)benzene mutase